MKNKLQYNDFVMSDFTIKENYIFSKKFDSSHLKQMVDYAHNDELVINQTSDAVRFSSLNSADNWLNKSKKVFFLLSPIDDKKKLAGIIWFEELNLPNSLKEKSNWTFGIRIYKNHRSNGLAAPFMKKAFEEFEKLFPNESVWLSTKSFNEVAQKVYSKFGFKKVGELNNKKYYIFKL
jgi:ribosomal protein S18 acetylase RimI-like enzyme